jgi:hypothetical protein
MAFRMVLTLAVLATSRLALAEADEANDRPTVRWEGPEACPEGDLLARVEGWVGLDREQLAAKLVSLVARVSVRAEGDWHAQIAVETVAGSGERGFDAEDCRTLRDGIALIAALAIDPSIQVPATSAVPSPTPVPGRSTARPDDARAATPNSRPRLVLRPMLGADLRTLPEVGLSYGLAAGLAWPHVRLEVDGRTVSQQEITNAAKHGARIRMPLGAGGRACWQPALAGPAEPAACVGGTLDWLRSAGLGIATPETHDSLAVAVTVGAALGLRLRDWLWLRAEGHLGVSVKRPRFEIDGREEVYRVPLLRGFVGGGIEFRL